MANAAELYILVRDELAQRREEGYNVDAYAAWFAAVAPTPEAAAGKERQLESLLDELAAAPPPASFPYVEPSTLEEIRQERPEGPRRLDLPYSEEELFERIHGAWLGRAAGCLLGKPVEGWSRRDIRRLLEHAGHYPLRDFFPWVENPPADLAHIARRPRNWFAGAVDRMVRDDDMDYPIVALHTFNQRGPDFTTADIAYTWLTCLPYLLVYTAERAAYRNLVNGLTPGLPTATYRNPYREWIGAQIRADFWGWVCPGWPERAAEFAFRDAALSHVKNGIYGAMFFAAVIAAAFATPSAEEALRIGLSEIPQHSRLAEAVTNVMRWSCEDQDYEKTLDRIAAAYGHYHHVHTINNAALVVAGLMYAQDELEPAICISVMGGWDTDCNGATAGSVIGALRGAGALPPKWTGHFNDRLESAVLGYTGSSISSLARQTFERARRLRASG